jgi:hypothetical protein
MSATMMASNLMASRPGTDCPVCSPSDLDVDFEAFEEYEEFFIRQKRVQRHGELAGSAFHHADSVWLKKEVLRYVDITKKVQLRALDRFGNTKGLFAWSMVRVGLYHPQSVGLQLLRESQEVKDCLVRSPLHYLLDEASITNHKEPGEAAIGDQKRFINDQDRLGRSPLHIASQGGLFLAVQYLLKLGADTGLSTNYNSTPLHYVAAEGHAHICQVLLENTVVYNIGQRDQGGHTAMGYAILHGHANVQKVLTEFQSGRHIFISAIA